MFGTGFGALQNATLALMYARVPTVAYGTVSAIWNGAYDLGMGVGAIAVGALVAVTGFSGAFLIVAATMLPALALARHEAQSDLVRSAEVDPLPSLLLPGSTCQTLSAPKVAESLTSPV